MPLGPAPSRVRHSSTGGLGIGFVQLRSFEGLPCTIPQPLGSVFDRKEIVANRWLENSDQLTSISFGLKLHWPSKNLFTNSWLDALSYTTRCTLCPCSRSRPIINIHFIRCIWGWLLRVGSQGHHHLPYETRVSWLLHPAVHWYPTSAHWRKMPRHQSCGRIQRENTTWGTTGNNKKERARSHPAIRWTSCISFFFCCCVFPFFHDGH